MPDLEREQQLLRRRLLGWAPRTEPIFPGLDHGRDLVLAVNSAGRVDLSVVEGMDNLGQGLTVALTTARGSDVFNMSFGFDGLTAMVEEKDAVLARERIRVGVVDVLRREPRIRRIVEISAPTSSSDPHAPLTDQIAQWRTCTVSVSFETITGEHISLDLGGALGNA